MGKFEFFSFIALKIPQQFIHTKCVFHREGVKYLGDLSQSSILNGAATPLAAFWEDRFSDMPLMAQTKHMYIISSWLFII